MKSARSLINQATSLEISFAQEENGYVKAYGEAQPIYDCPAKKPLTPMRNREAKRCRASKRSLQRNSVQFWSEREVAKRVCATQQRGAKSPKPSQRSKKSSTRGKAAPQQASASKDSATNAKII